MLNGNVNIAAQVLDEDKEDDADHEASEEDDQESDAENPERENLKQNPP